MEKTIIFKEALDKIKTDVAVENDDLSQPFFKVYKNSAQLEVLTAQIEQGRIHHLRAKEVALSIVSVVHSKLVDMEYLFDEVMDRESTSKDLLDVMGIAEWCHGYLNMFFARFSHYPECGHLIRSTKNAVIYQELFSTSAINSKIEEQSAPKSKIDIL